MDKPMSLDEHIGVNEEPKAMGRVAKKLGRSGTGASTHEHYSSSSSKTLRAAMGFSFCSTGSLKRPKEC
jgi:hypothetical protein